MCSEASGACAVVVGIILVWDLAVFFGCWEAFVADGAGPVFGVGGHDFCKWLFSFYRSANVATIWFRSGKFVFAVVAVALLGENTKRRPRA